MQPQSFLELPNLELPIGPRPTPRSRVSRGSLGLCRIGIPLVAITLAILPSIARAHGVEEGDASFLQSQTGFHFWPYFYLGAKHMVTGYDHLLFLAGVVFFLYKPCDVATYVTLFALGHSLTLLAGVYFDIPANAYLIDAVIGFSVVYKAFENIGGFQRIGIQIDSKTAVAVFGLFHGFGLATKLQQLTLSEEGLLGNLLAFNLGVETGQLLALLFILSAVNLWRVTAKFGQQAVVANGLIMACGFGLILYQLTGYFVELPVN
ncbi:MAG: HupE/UreJ family protein [Pseudomonadales bacterium]|nr:HupE/UreJ family protein [Pseudomonadales bacterium]